MEIIKFSRIVSVNNELQGHSAQNILNGEISPNKNWMCEKGTEKAVVILQLERAVVLTSIHVGNAHSAFVEILVGKAADSSDHFESLVPMSVFMNPHESKTGTNPNRTRFFNKEDFTESTAKKAWDRIKVVCSQPFNKYVPYGLCFLKVHGEKEVKKLEVLPKVDDMDDIQIGSFFKKRSSGGDKSLTDTEAKKEASDVKQTPISIAKIGKKLSSEKKLKPTYEEKREKEVKKLEDKAPKRKKDENFGEQVTAKKKKDEQKEDKTLKKNSNEKTEDKKTPKRVRKEEQQSGKKKGKKPFEKLMEDVVLVISGFKNPLRGDIRSMALKMGAKYSADWGPNCTHLVCAYENTPKFLQVKKKGKIVKKDWVEKCHKDKKRYPWRRFALDKSDLKRPESEEEIEAGEESESEGEVPSTSKLEASAQEKFKKSTKENLKSDDDYDKATDDDEDIAADTTEYPMPHLLDIFSCKTFYIDPSLQSKAILERYIVAYNGLVTDTLHEGVDFYVVDKGGVPLDLFRKKAPNLLAIRPSWIWEINSKQKYISTTMHLVK